MADVVLSTFMFQIYVRTILIYMHTKEKCALILLKAKPINSMNAHVMIWW